MVFWKKEKVEETSSERLSKLEKRLTRIEAELLDLAVAQDTIRNKVLRKIQFKKEKEEEEDKPQDLYSKVLIPER